MIIINDNIRMYKKCHKYFKVISSICLVFKFLLIYIILLFPLKNPIDYRTQAIAMGNPAVVGTAGRALIELARTGIGSVEVARRHSPISNILVEISKSIHISVGKYKNNTLITKVLFFNKLLIFLYYCYLIGVKLK